jgi:outer membrane protein assembly factor BamB
MTKNLVLILLLVCFLSACAPAITAPPPTSTPAPTHTPLPDPGSLYWTFQTGGAIWGTPTVQDDVLYIGSDDKNLYALDALTGEVEWQFPTGDIVRSTPALAHGNVYFESDDGYLYAVDSRTGAEVWRIDIGNVIDPAARDVTGTVFDYLQSSPAIVEDTLYIGSADGNVYAVDAIGGEILWKFDTTKPVRATPTVVAGVLYIGSWNGIFYALDAANGELHWMYEASTIGNPDYYLRPIQSKALVVDGLVICASRKASVFALDIETGELKWEHRYGNALWVESSPMLQDGIIYIGSSGSKFVLALEAEDGDPRGIQLTQTFNWGTPALMDDTLYIGGAVYQDPKEKAGLVALKTDDGAITGRKWNVPIETTQAAGDWYGVASSPIVVGDTVYFGALDGKVYAAQR